MCGERPESTVNSETWNPDRGIFYKQIHGPLSEAAIADVADIPEEPRETIGFRRLLHGTDCLLPGSSRLYRDPT